MLPASASQPESPTEVERRRTSEAVHRGAAEFTPGPDRYHASRSRSGSRLTSTSLSLPRREHRQRGGSDPAHPPRSRAATAIVLGKPLARAEWGQLGFVRAGNRETLQARYQRGRFWGSIR